MDLWIRSQNRENTIKIINQYGLKFNDKKTIIANFQPDFTDKYDGYYEVLGTYKTEERALEVLDEIQNILKPRVVLDKSSIKENGDSWMDENGMIFKNYTGNARIEQLNCYVYEMPKK